jgi:2-polyprenyl-6-methoxyphenol hydroxylase-like FAD-dependent oxidoreductase
MVDVIIIGAGPAGLTLGAELASRGISCRIYEKRLIRTISSRAIGLLSYTLDLLDTRDMADPMIAHGLIIDKVPLGDKSYLNLTKLHAYTRFPFMLSIPQNQTEALLESWALKSGVTIVKGTTLLAVEQTDDSVCITLSNSEKSWQEHAKYLIGCDGLNSTVRLQLGISTIDVNYNKHLMHGDVKLSNLPQNSVFANITRKGMVAAFPLPGNYYRVLILDHDKMNNAGEHELTLDEFSESATKLAKMNLGISDPLWLSRFKAQQKHACQYRMGRVFLVGDAAHGHMPAGGQGLQSAIEDAFNLGWKLASVLNARISNSILDSYEFERRQVAANAMRKSKFLFKYEVSNSYMSYILRKLLSKIIKFPILENYVTRSLSGLANYYKYLSKSQSSYIGKSVLNYCLLDKLGDIHEIRVLLRNKKGIFLSTTGVYPNTLNGAIQYDSNIDYIHGHFHEDRRIRSMIIRPDGIVAWATYL